MEGLVNYSSEDEQDDYSHSKVALRERGSGVSSSGRSSLVSGVDSSGGPLKRRRSERSKSESQESDPSPHRRGRDVGGERERYRSGNTSNYNDEDKNKPERRTEKLRDHREKRERESKESRSYGDDNGHKHDYKKHEDYKRNRDPKRDTKRDNKDYNRDDKRYNRNDDRKSAYTSNNNRERFNSSKPRYDDRKHNDDRTNDERRFNDDRRFDDRKRDFNDRRSNDDRKSERRNKEDRRSHRSYNEDRSNVYRPKRSGSPLEVSRSNSNKYDRDEHNAKRDRNHHSRSKSPTRSRSVEKSVERDQITLNNSQRVEGVEHQKETRPEIQATVTEKRTLPTARNFEALLSLNLSETASKQANVPTKLDISTTSSLNNTSATVQLPSYYNPNVINPNKYVEQMQKRKLIWGAKKVEDSASKWGHAQFSQDQDGKVASKFMRLMGIKSGTGAESSTSPNESEMKSPTSSISPSNSTDVKSREAMFSTMEQQYEVARQVTHTMRGVGLGFGSQPRPY